MKQIQIKYTCKTAFLDKLSELKVLCQQLNPSDMSFYINWSCESVDKIPVVTECIESMFPDALYYGNETSGNIADAKLHYGINIVCSVFEEPTSKLELLWVKGPDFKGLPTYRKEKTVVDSLWDYCKPKSRLCAVEMIPAMASVVDFGLPDSVVDMPENIHIFGGVSVNLQDPRMGSDILAKGYPMSKEGMVVILYYGENLSISSDYILGWKGLGLPMTITKSSGNIINEIEGMPAFEVYERYLNVDDSKRAFSDHLWFPLIVEDEGVEYLKNLLDILPDKSIACFSGIKEGLTTRIAFGSKDVILNSIFKRAKNITQLEPQAIKIFSCLARRFFWSDAEVDKETAALGDIASTSGFYTGGEITRIGNKIRILNSTIVAVTFREGELKGTYKTVKISDESRDDSTVARLAHFVGVVQEDLKEMTDAKMREFNQISKLLVDSYIAVYFCDLATGKFQVVGYNRQNNIKPMPITDLNYDLELALHRYVTRVHEEDRHLLLDIADNPKGLLSQHDGHYNAIFRRFVDVDGTNDENNFIYCEVGCVQDADDKNKFLLSIRNVDKVIREEMERKKQLEMALQMAQSASRAKTTFLNNMSHDIRTPMNAIIGFTGMALRNLGKDDNKVRECVEKIGLSGGSLLELINDILEISRIESGRIEFTRDKGDVYYSFVGIDTMMHELAGQHDISLSFDFGKITDRYVVCDFSHCNRIFTNVISNAIKYTPPGGWVKVHCEQIESTREGYANFKYVIKDNGIGMSEEFQKHLFEQFARENSSTVSKIQGSGLGLALCKNLIERMGGTITCDSKQGLGSTFTIILPFEKQQGNDYREPELVVEISGESSFKGKNILLVEDNELNREIACEILENLGFNVTTAEDGDIAVDKVRQAAPGTFALILMDIQMPRMNGYEATRAIRAFEASTIKGQLMEQRQKGIAQQSTDSPDDNLLPNRNHIPIIALSANAFEEDRHKAFEAGMDDHIAKPIDVENLRKTLTKYV